MSEPAGRATGAPATGSRNALAGPQKAVAGAASGAVTARARPLAAPRPVRVEAAPDGRPVAIAGRAVEAIREEWVVQDRWWTAAPLRRRYFELVLADGRNVVVFHDLRARREADAWFTQRG